MAATVLSDEKVREVLFGLARGQSLATAATRSHLPAVVVEGIAQRYGWPDMAQIVEAAKQMRGETQNAAPRRAQPAVPIDQAAKETASEPTWSSGPRTVELLIREARRIGLPKMVELATKMWDAAGDLTDMVDAYHQTLDERNRLLAELEELDARKQVVLDQFSQINAPYLTTGQPIGIDVVREQVENRHTIEEPPDGGLWWKVTGEATRIREWAETNGVPCSKTGRIQTSTIEAWLAANPEADPRG